MRSTVWAELGLQWASLERPEAHRRLADTLERWRALGPVGREALQQLVLGGRQPSAEARAALKAARMVHGSDQGPVAPLYPGAAAVALDETRRRLTPPQASALLDWYRRGDSRVSQVYLRFHRDRPHGAHVTFGVLDRAGLIERAEGRRLYRSTARGWAVAWLLDDAAVLELAAEGAA